MRHALLSFENFSNAIKDILVKLVVTLNFSADICHNLNTITQIVLFVYTYAYYLLQYCSYGKEEA